MRRLLPDRLQTRPPGHQHHALPTAGDLSDDAADALEMLDPVSMSSPWVSEIKTLFKLSDEDVSNLFSAMRAVQV